jgi:hypothetical protein
VRYIEFAAQIGQKNKRAFQYSHEYEALGDTCIFPVDLLGEFVNPTLDGISIDKHTDQVLG